MKIGELLPQSLRYKIIALATSFHELLTAEKDNIHLDSSVAYLEWLFAMEKYRNSKDLPVYDFMPPDCELDLLELVKQKMIINDDDLSFLERQDYKFISPSVIPVNLQVLNCNDLALTNSHCLNDAWLRLEELSLKKCPLSLALWSAPRLSELPITKPASLAFYSQPLFNRANLNKNTFGLSIEGETNSKKELKIINMYQEQSIDLNMCWIALL